MILVTITVLLATAAGVASDHVLDYAHAMARAALGLMLYALAPFVAFVSFVHLHLSLGGGVGLVLAYFGLGCGGVLAWMLARRLGVTGPALGGLICTVILVNTGYLGLPSVVALLGAHVLPKAVAYDQVVSGPIVFTVGFAVGAAFGTQGGAGKRERLMVFLTRNPPLLAAVAGLLAPAAAAPTVLVHASHVVVGALLVIGFFVVGVHLSAERRDDAAPLLERPDRRVMLALALRFTVTPAVLGLAALAGVGIPTAYFLQAAMPTGINSLIVGHAYGLDQRLIATVIVWSTLLALVGLLVLYLV